MELMNIRMEVFNPSFEFRLEILHSVFIYPIITDRPQNSWGTNCSILKFGKSV